jgi:hypothetical protein
VAGQQRPGRDLVDGRHHFTTRTIVGPNPGPTWHVKAASDFDGDGNSDIVWQDDSGQAAIWLMDGINTTTRAITGPNPGADWHVSA